MNLSKLEFIQAGKIPQDLQSGNNTDIIDAICVVTPQQESQRDELVSINICNTTLVSCICKFCTILLLISFILMIHVRLVSDLQSKQETNN
jgi:hypothetical protein